MNRGVVSNSFKQYLFFKSSERPYKERPYKGSVENTPEVQESKTVIHKGLSGYS